MKSFGPRNEVHCEVAFEPFAAHEVFTTTEGNQFVKLRDAYNSEVEYGDICRFSPGSEWHLDGSLQRLFGNITGFTDIAALRARLMEIAAARRAARAGGAELFDG